MLETIMWDIKNRSGIFGEACNARPPPAAFTQGRKRGEKQKDGEKDRLDLQFLIKREGKQRET